MTGPLSPEQLEELMAGYVLGDLSPEEAEEFGRLLAENPQLATEVSRLQETMELLPYALPEAEPPPQLRSAILDAVQAETTPKPVQQRSRLPWSKIAGSIAALLALALGLDNYRLRQELKIAQTQKDIINVLQRPNTRIFSLAGTDKANTAYGSIVLNLDEQKAFITYQNLPALPADQIYRLWAIIDNQEIACAQFSASQQGFNELSIAGQATDACRSTKSTFAVSLEPSSLPPKRVGPVVMLERSL